MKKILFYLTILSGVMLFASCNEELTIDSYEQAAPVIASFTPESGPVGTEITVTGENLQKITEVYINDKEVEVKNRISSTQLILKATSDGRTGVIKLVSVEGETVSASAYTYVYSAPAISQDQSPTQFEVGSEVLFIGTSLDAVLSVSFNGVAAEIKDQLPTELVVLVPDIKTATANITFSYFDGSADVSSTIEDVSMLRAVPSVDGVTASVDVGKDATITGKYLHLVEKVTLGGIEMPIVTQPENGESLTFTVNDSYPEFDDGINSDKEIVLYSFESTEKLNVEEPFSFFVPEFYDWKNKKLNGHSTIVENHFFCLDTGETFAAEKYAADVDPLAISHGGAVCSGKNTLASTVEEEQYYGVKPYIYAYYLGSGMYFYGPANNSNRMVNFVGAGFTPKVVSYGTPIIQFRTLTPEIPAEKVIIDKIKGGTFVSDDFTPALLDDIDLTQDGAVDGYSNVPNGELPAYKAKGATNSRPWAPNLPAPKETVDIELNTVVLVFYMKPNWTSPLSLDKANIYKFGFLDLTNLWQDGNKNSGRQNAPTFNVYWQRTPMTN